MNSSFKLGVLAAAFALVFLCVGDANAQMRVATVDLAKVFDSYSKAKEAAQRLKEAEKKAQDEVNARAESLKGMQETLKKMDADRKVSGLSEADRAEKERVYSEKINEARNMEREITDFRDTKRRQLEAQAVRMRGGIVEEILKAVTEKVRADGYDLVFDTSGRNLNGVPTVVYAKESYDVSEAIITSLNAKGSSGN